MASSRYAKVKRKPKHKTADDSWTAPAMFSDHRLDTCNSAINSVDQVARKLEQLWGIGRLERLASPKLAVQFEQARQNFNAAANGDDSNYLADKAANLITGWKALEQSAVKNGNKPDDPKVWHFIGPNDLGNKKYAIVDHSSEVNDTIYKSADCVYSLDEVARIIAEWENTHLGDMAAKVKELFPKSKITRIKDGDFIDEIPF
tara:strand:- start:266 stop:874 length:609 start_codon:yes stop_codon:yes gene_type:complete